MIGRRRRRLAVSVLSAGLLASAAAGCGGRGDETASASASPADRELAQRIRQALAADDKLSASAKTVAIVSDGGTVVLRGSVTSDQERAAVADTVRQMAGDRRVDNQLQVVRR